MGSELPGQLGYSPVAMRVQLPFEQIKVKLLQDNLKGAVLDQFLQDWKLWCMDENGNLIPDLIKVMDNLIVIFTTKIRDQDGFKLMKKPKPKERT
jgi:hypothetical protein